MCDCRVIKRVPQVQWAEEHVTHSKHCIMMVPGLTKSSSNVSRAHYEDRQGRREEGETAHASPTCDTHHRMSRGMCKTRA